MSFLSDYQLVESDKNFRDRCKIAILKVCIQVMAEDDQTANHANRITFANQSLLNGGNSSMIYGLVAQGTLSAESTDADIEFTVSSIFNAYAGI